MRLVKFILSSLVFILTFFIVIAAEYVTLTLVTAPGSIGGAADTAVERVHLFQGEDKTEVVYTDAFTFWQTDLKESYAVAAEDPSYSIRGWIDQPWWYNNMEWADTAYSYVKATVIPVVAPLYEIKELHTYYGRTIEDEIFKEMFLEKFSSVLYNDNGEDDGVLNRYLGDHPDNPLSPTKVERNYYQFFYNIELKIKKYNTPTYERFVEKFIEYTGDLSGVRGVDYEFTTIKATSAILYFQYFLAFILAVYFTYQNPIVIKKNGDGENQVEGKIFPKVPRFRFGKRKKHEKKVKK